MTLHVEEFGATSERAIVLLHGAVSSPDYMDPLGEALARTRYVLRFEMPGYGRSPASSPYQLDGVIRAIESEVVRREVKRIAIVGSSAGGYRALQLAIAGRLEVTHVVSLGGHAALSVEEQAGLRGLAGAVRAKHDLAAVVAPLMFSPAYLSANPSAVQLTADWLRAIAPDALADELEAYAGGPDLLPALRGLHTPTLAIVGDLDAAAPPHLSRAVAGAVPNGRLEVLPGRGHGLLYEAFDETLALVEAFLPPR